MPSDLLVSRLAGHSWAALREGGATVELHYDQARRVPGSVGDIFKGRVVRIVPGIQSAFVDIGLDRDAFLHVADLVLPGETPSTGPLGAAHAALHTDDDAENIVVSSELSQHPAQPSRPIQDRLKEGRELLVQVAREGGSVKGPRVTCHVSMAGRYLVHFPLLAESGVSRRITDEGERARLREIVDSLRSPAGGFVVRTAGEGVDAESFRADAAFLRAAWREVEQRGETVPAPARLHRDEDLLIRLLRDSPRTGFDRVIVDDPGDRERAVSYLAALHPAIASRVELHTGPSSLLQTHGVDTDIERALRPKVWLRSGAFIVIQQTEALVAIDVNSGKFLGRDQPEDTALRTNLEAAAEIARQLRLRDLGGIVVVDFIDMEKPENRRQVVEALDASLRGDRARTKIVGFAGLGLLHLTRQKGRRGLEPSLTRECPACGGQGRIKSADVVAWEALVEARRLTGLLDGALVTVRAASEVARCVGLLLQVVGASGNREERIAVEEDPSLGPDHFDVVVLSR